MTARCSSTRCRSTTKEFFKGESTYLRLERKGDKVTASYSHDGKEWTEAKEITVEPAMSAGNHAFA